MAKDANHRYQSAAEFRADIQRALQGMPVSANAASTMVMGGAAPQGTQVMSPVPGGPGGMPPHTRMQRPVNTGYDLPPVQYEDPEPPADNRKKIAIWALVVVLFIGGAAIVGYALSGGGGGDPKTNPSSSVQAVEVPDVEGKRQSDAEDELKKAGLKVGSVEEEFSSDIAEGRVISTDPAAGESVERGSEITLTVSKGEKPPEQVQVPDVTGQPAGSAKQTLESAGFKVSQRTSPSSDVEKGMVIQTNPRAGQQVDQGSTVLMIVSSGPENSQVPNVVGLTEADAVKALREAGLQHQVVTVPQQTPDQQVGTVVRQSLEAGRQVPPGSTVIIYVVQNGDGGDPGNGGNPGLPGAGQD
jgi:serine/threonine-protein kinase